MIGIISTSGKELQDFRQCVNVVDKLKLGSKNYLFGEVWDTQVYISIFKEGSINAASVINNLINVYGVKDIVYTGLEYSKDVEYGDIVCVSGKDNRVKNALDAYLKSDYVKEFGLLSRKPVVHKGVYSTNYCVLDEGQPNFLYRDVEGSALHLLGEEYDISVASVKIMLGRLEIDSVKINEKNNTASLFIFGLFKSLFSRCLDYSLF